MGQCSKGSGANADADAAQADRRRHSDTTSPPVAWSIVAIVKRKIVFAKRPVPVVGRPKDTTH